jgi:Flp pilus assembly secretin CpaC/osmotically-inducible protein OsmY
MKRWPRHSHQPPTPRLRPLLMAVGMACLFCLAFENCFASEALVLKQGDARILKFSKMTRVWVTDPSIIDVVVAGYNELLVYSKTVGYTKLYVWDAQGRHEYAVETKRLPTADQVLREISTYLGRGLRYRIVDDKTLFVDGEVESTAERDRVAQVVEASSGGLKVVNLVRVRDANLTPAESYRRGFEKLFPGQFTYTAIDDQTLVLEGEVATTAEKQRLTAILTAASGIKTVDLVRCLENQLTPQQQRIESIKQAVGDTYRYQALEDKILVISGEAGSEAELKRIDKIATAAAGDLTVINAVMLASDTRSPAVRYAEVLKAALGPQYKLTPMGDTGLVVEGVAPTSADEARVREIVDLLKGNVQVVNLVSAGGAQTAGQKTQAMLKEALGDRYQVSLLTNDVVLVDGLAATAAEKDRVDKLVAAVPSNTKVVNCVAIGEPGKDNRAAARYAEALRTVLGGNLTYRVLDENTLMIEGEATSAADKAKTDSILKALSGGVNVLNLVTVKPGLEAAGDTAAARKARVVQQVLGDKYKASVVDETTVLVQGVAPGEVEQQRIEGVLRQIAGDVTIVSMIDAGMGASTLTPAQRAIQSLKPVVPAEVKLVELDAKTVLVEGIVPTTIEKDRMDKIAEMTAKSSQVNVVSLVLTQMQSKTPAARRVEGLKKILGDKYNYIVWDDETVLVDGQVESQQELDRVTKILEAADKDWKVGNLVTYGASGAGITTPEASAAVVERLSQAIGEPYRVWHLKGNKYVVEGVSTDQIAANRLQEILKAFTDEGEILNLTTLAETPTISLSARAEALRTILGDDFQVKTLQGRAVVVEATVSTKAAAERARSIISAMGSDVPIVDLVTVVDPAKRQVVAHVKVVDLTQGGSKKLGIDWGNIVAGGQEGTVSFGDQPFLFNINDGAHKVGDIAANLNALRQNDQARILAEPNLVVNDGEEAEILVGGEVPIPVPQTGEGGSAITIEYKQYGVVLRIKPQIMADGKSVKLEVEPEVSSVDTSTQVSIGGIAVPAFRTRRAKTTLDMPDGATLVIGGLIQQDQSKVVRAIPFLSKLPILGEFFKSTDTQHSRNELVILVTPEILQPSKP